MDKNFETRLGTVGGASEVKQDPFFEGIDWEKLAEKKVKPPFIPSVVSFRLYCFELERFALDWSK
jgi:hypothetical protein